MGPQQLVSELLGRFPALDDVSVAELALAFSSKDKSRPRRAVAKHLDTALAFGLIAEDRGRVRLTHRGRCLREGGQGGERAIRAAFATEGLARRVGEALLRDTPLSEEEATTRLSMYGQASSSAQWSEWLEAGRLVLRTEAGLIAKADSFIPLIDAFQECDFWQMEREIYVRLVRSHRGSAPELRDLDEETLLGAYESMHSAEADQAEAAMLPLLDACFRIMGFEVQRHNGEREHRCKSKGQPSFDFGQRGDDLAAIFLRAPLVYSGPCAGWVLAIEAKAGAAPKKALGQAVTFAGRVTSAWGEGITAYPVVVSDRDAYVDRVAKVYARDNGVVHLPLEGIVELARLQWKRYESGRELITPPALLSFIQFARTIAYVEPGPQELAKTVEEVAERRSAAWLPDSLG